MQFAGPSWYGASQASRQVKAVRCCTLFAVHSAWARKCRPRLKSSHAQAWEQGLDMVEHDTLFTVYRHPSTACIFALGENKDTFVQVDKTDEGVSVKDVAFGAGVREMAKRLKLGYLMAPNKMYFNQRSGEFKLIHPDLDWKGLVWVLAAMPKNIEQACEKVAQVVKTVPASIILGEEIDAWMSQQSHNVAHVVAFGDLPVWTLALAQVALDNGWPLRATS